jgi:uncharacterized membrane protein YhaH (DUF805 family)
MTEFKKTLWRIVGVVPHFALFIIIAFTEPLSSLALAQDWLSRFVWFLLIFLLLLSLMPVFLWRSYCSKRAEEELPSGWQAFLQFLKLKRNDNLIGLAAVFVLFIVVIVFNIRNPL